MTEIAIEADVRHRGKRSYVGTKNNYCDEDILHLEKFYDKCCSFLVYGKEVGETGTPHLQIYFEMEDAKSMKAVIKNLGFNLWLGYRRGTPSQAAGYCRKGTEKPEHSYEEFLDTPSPTWEGQMYGHISQQGARNDLVKVADMIIQEQRPIREVALEFPGSFIRYHKGMIALRNHVLQPRSLEQAPEVIVLWGPTGTGKTRDAYTKYWKDEPHYVWRPSNGNWWDGYDGEKKVILDEFRGQMDWSDILGLLDRNEYRAPVKGSFVQIQADKFVITSPKPPHSWYNSVCDDHDKYQQLVRRITTVVGY